jgi:hypothetical protein
VGIPKRKPSNSFSISPVTLGYSARGAACICATDARQERASFSGKECKDAPCRGSRPVEAFRGVISRDLLSLHDRRRDVPRESGERVKRAGQSRRRDLEAREFEATHLRDLEQGDLGTRGLDLLGEGLGEGTDVAVCEEFGRKGRTPSVCVFSARNRRVSFAERASSCFAPSKLRHM